jgi:hypothetical protein
MGLLVLGGPNSFGLGGYRDSQLEALLPVVSEPPEDESPASLVFLIDLSGSMDQASATQRRLDIARQAVVETAKALRPVDRVGLMTFDVEPRELLAPESRPDHVRSIEQVWPGRASGGTQLMPALQRAIDTLEQRESGQKLLLLLTDGFLASEDLSQVEGALLDRDIELIAMIVDDGRQSNLDQISRIARASGGRAIRIDDVLRLPVLMRNEIESRRPALMTGQFVPQTSAPAAWMSGGNTWPAIDAYLLTSARKEAQVHLTSDSGDVLIASTNAGAGKVVAITSGVSDWTATWLRWDQWPDIAAGLINYVAAGSASDVDVTLQESGINEKQLRVDLPHRALSDQDLVATLVGPSGVTESIELRPLGPGQLGAELQLENYGRYSLLLSDGFVTTRQRFLNNRIPTASAEPPIAEAWLEDGVIQSWQPNVLRKYQKHIDWQSLLAGMALLGFLSVLIFERKDLVHNIVAALSRSVRRGYRPIA